MRISELEKWKAKLDDESRPMYASAAEPHCRIYTRICQEAAAAVHAGIPSCAVAGAAQPADD